MKRIRAILVGLALFIVLGLIVAANCEAKSYYLWEVEQILRAETLRWKGTRYQLGGTGRHGIDCSAYVMIAFRNTFGIRLPRCTYNQVRVGTYIKRSQLRVGDLVFFKTSRYSNHVGIYLGKGEFAHASASRGVTISSLYNGYWQSRYWTARRIFR
jgi:cell wall-associated NlpC family hydrolase